MDFTKQENILLFECSKATESKPVELTVLIPPTQWAFSAPTNPHSLSAQKYAIKIAHRCAYKILLLPVQAYGGKDFLVFILFRSPFQVKIAQMQI